MKKKRIIKALKKSLEQCHDRMSSVPDGSADKLKAQQYLTAIIHLTYTMGDIIETYDRDKSQAVHQA